MEAMMKLFSLTGKTAVITGGTRGIGQTMALALAEAGADIILIQVFSPPPHRRKKANPSYSPPTPQRDDSNKTTQSQIQALGRKATIYTADLSDPISVSQIIPSLASAGHDMHILLTCAGVQKRHPAHQFPDDDWSIRPPSESHDSLDPLPRLRRLSALQTRPGTRHETRQHHHDRQSPLLSRRDQRAGVRGE